MLLAHDLAFIHFRRGGGAFQGKENVENDENGNENKAEGIKVEGTNVEGKKIEKKYKLRETDKRLSRATKISTGKFSNNCLQ